MVLVILVAVVPLLAGCAMSTASPSVSAASVSRDAQYCERYGGIWHANLGVCEADMMP